MSTTKGTPLFRVYYDGGNTYDGDPFETPALGVLAIVQKIMLMEDMLHLTLIITFGKMTCRSGWAVILLACSII